ncbi:MAG: hypothetical protein IPI78_14830 [Chitinophagaceae bacterium]|nr:hypothetical protein [Chitinophagaceae bacterium]
MASCSSKNIEQKEEVVSASSLLTLLRFHDTISSTDKNLQLNNGLYYLNNLAYSGYIKVLYPDGSVNSIGGILNGMIHGRSVSYYPNGNSKDIRMYRENKSVGKQIGFWQNGNQKFEFYYLDDKREGSNKQWYESGAPYAFMNFKDDGSGMQQAWRNGKPYINSKDGFRYGLQKSNLCYTLEKKI